MSALHLPKYGLNIDRSSLPQVASADVPDYLTWLRTHKHITSIHTELSVSVLHPSQGNFNTTKIKEFMTHEREQLRKPIVVSSDYYVMDGHHRWIALLNLGPHETIPVILVHAKVLDLIAATKEYPKSFTKNVVESFKTIVESMNAKHAVIAYGRLNPPTAGHGKLIDKIQEVASQYKASSELVVSHTHDQKKNPLSQEKKLTHIKRFFPHANLVSATPEAPTLFHHATRLYNQGVQHLHVVAGDDRVKEFNDKLHKYNGKFDQDGRGYHFDSILVHSSGSRDSQGKGLESMSSSKMRQYASDGNFDAFRQCIPPGVSPKHTEELYKDLREGMGIINEQTEVLSEGVHDAAIFKAVFLAGAPGSGKDFVLKNSLTGHGLTEINSDTALEHLMDKQKLDKKMPESEQEKRNMVRDRAKSLTELRQRLALHGRNGLVINSTGADLPKIKRIKQMLDELGYDSKMVFVDASDNVSRNRNVERGQRGGRMIPEKLRSEKWRQAQDSRVEFSKMFGGEHYHEFNNDADLRQTNDAEVTADQTKKLADMHKTVKKFTEQPPKAFIAQEWIHKNLGHLAKKPVGNKVQQSKVIPASQDSQAKKEADKLGLTYYGYGKYGKNGHVTHFSLHGHLVEKQKALKPPVDPNKSAVKPAPSKLDEAFEGLLMEDTHAPIRLQDHLGALRLVRQTDGVVLQLQHLPTQVRAFGGRLSGLSESTGRSDTPEETLREEKEKIDYRTFRERLVLSGVAKEKEVLEEGEPTLDLGGDGGTILGTGTREEIDKTNGGIATNGPKKTLKKLRGDIK